MIHNSSLLSPGSSSADLQPFGGSFYHGVSISLSNCESQLSPHSHFQLMTSLQLSHPRTLGHLSQPAIFLFSHYPTVLTKHPLILLMRSHPEDSKTPSPKALSISRAQGEEALTYSLTFNITTWEHLHSLPNCLSVFIEDTRLMKTGTLDFHVTKFPETNKLFTTSWVLNIYWGN